MENKKNWSGLWEHAVVVLGVLSLMGFLLAEGASAQSLTAATFNKLSIAPGEFQFTITGFLYDESTKEPITSSSIEAYCDGQKKLENITDEQGGFSITGGYDLCAQGTDLLLKTNFKGDEYVQKVSIPEFVFLINRAGGGSGNSKKAAATAGQNANPAADSNINLLNQPKNTDPVIRITNASVPEFKTLTLAIAVVLVGLGLAFLRKQQ